MRLSTGSSARSSSLEFRVDPPSAPPVRVVAVTLPWQLYRATWPLAREWQLSDLEELILRCVRESVERHGEGT